MCRFWAGGKRARAGKESSQKKGGKEKRLFAGSLRSKIGLERKRTANMGGPFEFFRWKNGKGGPQSTAGVAGCLLSGGCLNGAPTTFDGKETNYWFYLSGANT